MSIPWFEVRCATCGSPAAILRMRRTDKRATDVVVHCHGQEVPFCPADACFDEQVCDLTIPYPFACPSSEAVQP